MVAMRPSRMQTVMTSCGFPSSRFASSLSAAPCGFHSSPNTIAELGQRLRAHQIHSQPLKTRIGQVEMSIIESRHHEMAVEVNDSSFGSFQLEYVAFLANILNAAVPDGHGIRALGLMKR